MTAGSPNLEFVDNGVDNTKREQQTKLLGKDGAVKPAVEANTNAAPGLLQIIMRNETYEVLCTLLLSIAGMLMFVGFDAHGFILESVTHSIHLRDPNRIDSYAGYYGLAISHICYAFANLLAPLLIFYAHPKWSLFFGSIGFTVYNIGFLYLNNYYFYSSAFFLGVGLALFYIGHGCYLSEHSTKKHMARNASVNWGVTCLSFTIGGIILIYFLGDSQERDIMGRQQYSDSQIQWIFGAFVVCSLLANLIFGLLPKPEVKNAVCRTIDKTKDSLGNQLKSIFKTFGNPNIWWLSTSWVSLGLMISFQLGVYPTALIFTTSLQGCITSVVLYSIAYSGGEVAIAVVVSILERKYSGVGRAPTFIMGFVVNLAATLIALLSTPRDAPYQPTTAEPLLFMPNFFVALFVGFLLGIGDGCWNISRSCLIPLLLSDQRAESFSISKVFQSLGSCLMFFLGPSIDLYGHVGLLLVSNVIGTITYLVACRRYSRSKYDKHFNIAKSGTP